MELIFEIESEAELDAVAETILAEAGARRKFILQGDMGTGKTTLVRAFGRKLGVRDEVASPTYPLIHEYSSAQGAVFHLDLYRLKSDTEALQIGVEDILYNGAWCFIEWPALIEPYLPLDVVRIRLQPRGRGGRTITVVG